MSVLTVTVAGVDRTEFWHEPTSTNWEDPLNGRGTGSITFVVPLSAGVRFSDGQEIVILEDGTPRFGGQLMEPEETERGDNDQNAVLFFNCQIADNNILADQRIVSEEWVDTEFSLIVSGVVTNWMYDEGISLAGVQTGAAFSIEAGNVLARDVFDTLADKSKRGWRFDESKVLHFKDRDQDAAPFGMNGSTMLRGSVTVRPDRQTYRNWQLVEAGTQEFPILIVSGNATEIADRAAITGTSGRVEHLAQNLEITNPTIAREWTGELLNKYDAIGAVVVGKTRLPGFHAGQEVVVDFPNHDIDEVDMLIDSVNAEVVAVGNEQEIWYTIRAITGDPYGGYQQHYRKVAPIKGPLRFTNEPGDFFVDPTPGVVIHDPIPGDFVWFQAAKSGSPTRFPNAFGITNAGDKLVTVRMGGLANTDGCGGGEFPGFEGTPACFANRQIILDVYLVGADNVIATVPDFGTSTDRLNSGSNIKQAICISPDDRHVVVIQADVGQTDLYVFDLNANAFTGSVTSTIPNNSNLSEPVWVGNVCYFLDGQGSTLWMFDISNPTAPTETTFATSLTIARSLVASPDGSVLYGCGGTEVVALDISSPLAPVEDTSLTISKESSLDINDAGDHLLMCFRNDASNLRVQPVSMTPNGTDIVLGTMSVVPLSTAAFEGFGMVWRGDTAVCWSEIPTAPADSLFAAVLDATDPDAVTLIETLQYEHGTTANNGPFRNQAAAKVFFWFGGLSSQFTFGEAQIEEPVPLTIDNPLRSGFGGTGLGTAFTGNIIYANRNLPDDDRGHGEWTRLGIGEIGQVLIVSGQGDGSRLPAWGEAGDPVPVDQLFFVGEDVLVVSGAVASLDDLEAVLVSGVTYYFRAELYVDPDADLGAKYGMGGTATGNVIFQIKALDDDTGAYSLLISGRKTAFDDFAGEDEMTRGYVEMTGSIECTGDGTLVPKVGTFV